MNLAICSAGELFGGVERHIVGMGTWLMRQGRQPLVILFHDRELAGQLRGVGIEPVILPSSGPVDPGAIRRLGSILATDRIDVVHAHGYKAVVNCALARRHHQAALVRTVHGLVESAGWWTWSGFKGHVYTRLERFLARRTGAASVYVTEDLRQRHDRFDRGLIAKTIYNGIDPLDRGDYARPGDLEEGRFHLCAVGRVTRIKDLECAVRAVAMLDPGLEAVLNIIGTGPLEDELKELTAELGATDRVRFLGFKKNVYDYMAHSDALVMPSRHEGLPYTLLEYLSLGGPVIATRTGGLGEVLEGMPVAELVEVGSTTGLFEALKKTIIAGRGHRPAGGGGALDLSLDSMGRQYWQLYESIAPAHRESDG